MSIHRLQHVPFEGLGSIEGWARRQGHTLTATRLYCSDRLPEAREPDWLIVMGGPMNAYEERVVGLQFHLERTRKGAEDLISNCGNEVVEGPFIQGVEAILASDARFLRINERMEKLLGALPVGQSWEA